VQLTPTGVKYLTTITLPEFFEGDPVETGASLFRVNVTGSIQREGTTRDGQYRLIDGFSDVYSGIPGTLMDDMARSFTSEERMFSIQELRKGVIIQSGYNVKTGDRFAVSASEYYRVEVIERNRFEGLIVCYLAEDTR
jgi:hypothetical protein